MKSTPVQARRHGEHFEAVPPSQNHCLCLPPSEDCAPKEGKKPGATGVHFRACAPPPQVWVKSRTRTNNSSERQGEA